MRKEKKERPVIIPEVKYNFKQRIKEMQIEIEKCLREIKKAGFPSKKAFYSISKIIEERRAVQLSFSPPIARVVFKISKQARVRKMISKLQQAENHPDIKIITVTPKKIFLMSEGGLSVLKYLISIACKIIKKQIKNKQAKERKKIKNNKEKIKNEIKNIIKEKNEKIKIISVSYLIDKYRVTIMTIRNSKIILENSQPQKVIEMTKEILSILL